MDEINKSFKCRLQLGACLPVKTTHFTNTWPFFEKSVTNITVAIH